MKLILLPALLFSFTNLYSQVIQRDLNFAGDGAIDYGTALVLQNDQKIIAVATVQSGGYSEPVLLRYHPSGEIDLSFSGDGEATIPVGNFNDYFTSAAVQADGKIVAGGVSNVTSGYYSHDFLLTRFNPDGSVDNTFDSDGKVITSFSSSTESLTEVLIQPDNKILAGGYIQNNSIALARYLPDGSPDSTFGVQGRVISFVDYGLMGGPVRLLNDGKILVTAISGDNIFLLRYDSNGNLDPAFGVNGIAEYDTGSSQISPLSIVVQNDGKIIFPGNFSDKFAVFRFNADGTIDSGFHFNGVYYITTGFYAKARAVVQQSDGKLLFAGGASFGDYELVMLRLNTDGTLDPLSANNYLQYDPGIWTHDHVNSLLLQNTDDILVHMIVEHPGEEIPMESQTWRFHNDVCSSFVPVITQDENILTCNPYLDAYQWFFNGEPLAGETNNTLEMAQSGNYSIEVRLNDSCTKVSDPVLYCVPFLPSFTQNGNLFSCDQADGSYQWLLNGTALPGEINDTLQAGQSGIYSVLFTDSLSCTHVSGTSFYCFPELVTVNQDGNILHSDQTADSYQWYLDGTPLNGETGSTLDITQSGNYFVSLGTSDSCVNISDTMLYCYSFIPGITRDENSLICDELASTYQWYLNGELLNGETNSTLEMNQEGSYFVVTEDSYGCTNTSDTAFYELLPFASLGNKLQNQVEIFPNPVDDRLLLKTNFADIAEVEIMDFSGKLMEIKKFNQQTHEINVKNYAPGVYFLSFTSMNEVYRLKFIKK